MNSRAAVIFLWACCPALGVGCGKDSSRDKPSAQGCLESYGQQFDAFIGQQPYPLNVNPPRLSDFRSRPSAVWTPFDDAANFYESAGAPFNVPDRATQSTSLQSADGRSSVNVYSFPVEPASTPTGKLLGGVGVVEWPDGRVETIVEVLSLGSGGANLTVFSAGIAGPQCTSPVSQVAAQLSQTQLSSGTVRVQQALDLSACGMCSLLVDFTQSWAAEAVGALACVSIGVGTAGVGGVVCVAIFAVVFELAMNCVLDAAHLDNTILCTPATRQLGLITSNEICPSANPDCEAPIPLTSCSMCRVTYGCGKNLIDSVSVGLACEAAGDAFGMGEPAGLLCGMIGDVATQEASAGTGIDAATVCQPFCEPQCGDHICGDGEEQSCPGDCGLWTCSVANGEQYCFGDSICSNYETCASSPTDCKCLKGQGCFADPNTHNASCQTAAQSCLSSSTQSCLPDVGTADGGVTVDGGIPDLGTAGDATDGGAGGIGGNSADGATGGSGGSNGIPAGTPGPSCTGLASTCGPSGNESCCTSLLVPGGTFYRNYDGVNYGDKSYPATVSDFALDKYESTVGRFRAFVNAGMGTQANPPAPGAGAHPLIPGSGWDSAWNTTLPADAASQIAAMKCSAQFQTWTDTPGGNENRPQDCLAWSTAFAFCAWDGGRLPTEAEWNYAAAGGSEQRVYPWSNPPSSTSIDHTRASYECMGDGVSACSSTDFIVVGSRPAGNGRWGHADLAGNVEEWMLDYSGAYQTPCHDCVSALAYYRSVRGGNLVETPSSLLNTSVSNGGSGTSVSYSGARCARSADGRGADGGVTVDGGI